MRHIDLFSGIGGFALAASWVWPEHEVAAFCERDAYCQRVLRHHWPDVPIVPDIHDFNGADYANVDLLTGGFPCQPFSSASSGRRKGTQDDRYLWPEMHRVIRRTRPRWVVCENVTHLDGVALDEVVFDLEAEGYEVAPPLEIPACAIGQDHRRSRLWIFGHADGNGEPGLPLDAEMAGVPRCRGEPGSVGAPDGVSGRVDRHRLRALGNAIVPQIAAEIFRAIKASDETSHG